MCLLNFIFFFTFNKKKKLSIFLKKKCKYNNLISFKYNKNIPRSSLFQKKILEQLFLFYYFFSQIVKPNIAFSENFQKNQLKKAFFTKSGIKYILFSKGYTISPEWGNIIEINYVIYLLLDKEILKLDSTYERGKPFIYRHGNGQIIIGLEEAIHNMNLMEKRRILIPDNLGYINKFLGPIPSFELSRNILYRKNLYDVSNQNKNSLLIIDIELTKIKQDID